MAASSSSPSADAAASTITDLSEDSIGLCATNLTHRDVCNLAMSSTSLRRLAYSDSVWHHLFKDRWHRELPSSNGTSVRELYVSRHTALQQFKFIDPFTHSCYTRAYRKFNHLLLHQNNVIFAQGTDTGVMNYDDRQNVVKHTMSDHKAEITCMRLYSLGEQNVVATSSYDSSICLWWKDSFLRCLRGHSGPVLSLSNKLLGDGSSKVLASGGEDRTVRLWSLNSSGKKGQRALKATLYGHEKAVCLMSVSGHKTSHLVTISRDSKVKVWDTTRSSSVSSCVGITSVHGTPVNMKCHESLLYVADSLSVTAIDLRTMQRVLTAAVHQPKLCSFDIAPSKSVICTGGDGRALLWDIRRNQNCLKPKPITELDGHSGRVTKLHMDSYKIVTGGSDYGCVKVWDVGTGEQTNSFDCCLCDKENCRCGCDAIAIDGCRIVTASYHNRMSVVSFRDFNNAKSPTTKLETYTKFWDSRGNRYN